MNHQTCTWNHHSSHRSCHYMALPTNWSPITPNPLPSDSEWIHTLAFSQYIQCSWKERIGHSQQNSGIPERWSFFQGSLSKCGGTPSTLLQRFPWLSFPQSIHLHTQNYNLRRPSSNHHYAGTSLWLPNSPKSKHGPIFSVIPCSHFTRSFSHPPSVSNLMHLYLEQSSHQ